MKGIKSVGWAYIFPTTIPKGTNNEGYTPCSLNNKGRKEWWGTLLLINNGRNRVRGAVFFSLQIKNGGVHFSPLLSNGKRKFGGTLIALCCLPRHLLSKSNQRHLFIIFKEIWQCVWFAKWRKSVGALRCSDIIVAVPLSCSSVFLYKCSHFSVFCMHIQYYFYKELHIYIWDK